MLRRWREWKVVAGAVFVFTALQVPFLYLLPSFLRAVASRTGVFDGIDNISPADLVCFLSGSIKGWNLVFDAPWLGTLLFHLACDQNENFSRVWPVYVPWMISSPLVVHPYSGVLALALLAVVAGESQRRSLLTSEKVIVIGAGLLGFQATVWASAFAFLGKGASQIHCICALGTLLMMIGACGLPRISEAGNPKVPRTLT